MPVRRITEILRLSVEYSIRSHHISRTMKELPREKPDAEHRGKEGV